MMIGPQCYLALPGKCVSWDRLSAVISQDYGKRTFLSSFYGKLQAIPRNQGEGKDVANRYSPVESDVSAVSKFRKRLVPSWSWASVPSSICWDSIYINSHNPEYNGEKGMKTILLRQRDKPPRSNLTRTTGVRCRRSRCYYYKQHRRDLEIANEFLHGSRDVSRPHRLRALCQRYHLLYSHI